MQLIIYILALYLIVPTKLQAQTTFKDSLQTFVGHRIYELDAYLESEGFAYSCSITGKKMGYYNCVTLQGSGGLTISVYSSKPRRYKSKAQLIQMREDCLKSGYLKRQRIKHIDYIVLTE